MARGLSAPSGTFSRAFCHIKMFSPSGFFGNDDPNEDQSFFSSQNPFSSSESFIRNGRGAVGLVDNLSPSTSNPLISSISSTIELEQIQQARECLEASASYMQDIESFFRDLSSSSNTLSFT